MSRRIAITLDIEDTEHTRAKREACLQGLSLADYCAKAIHDAVTADEYWRSQGKPKSRPDNRHLPKRKLPVWRVE
jgi:hypothetical protein